MIANLLGEAMAALTFGAELAGIARKLEESEIDRQAAERERLAAHGRYEAMLAQLAPDIAKDRAKRDVELARLPRVATLQPPVRPELPTAPPPTTTGVPPGSTTGGGA